MLNFRTVCGGRFLLQNNNSSSERNTYQDDFEKEVPSPKVINLTQTLAVNNPMPSWYLEASDYVEYI